MTAVTGPLVGTRIIDMGEVLAGPFCSNILADLGADVIKLETPTRLPALSRGGLIAPSTKRRYGYPKGLPGDRPYERYVILHGAERNKRGLGLDVRHPRGNELFARLLARVDGIVTNYSAGVLERLGFPDERLRALNPRLVATLMPGFGNTGPYRSWLAFGMMTDFVCGRAICRGYPETSPYDTPVSSLPDTVGGLHAAFATLMALQRAKATGEGAIIDISHAECMQQHLGEFLARDWLGQEARTRGNREPGTAPHGNYRCRDDEGPTRDPNATDRWIAVAVRTDAEWDAFARVLGGGLDRDERFRTLIHRKRNEDALDEAINALTVHHDRWELAMRLQMAGVPAAPVINDYDLRSDRTLYERGVLARLRHPYAGDQDYNGPIFQFARNPVAARRPPATLGQHNHEILGDILGLSPKEIEALEAEGVIGSEYRLTAAAAPADLNLPDTPQQLRH